MADYDFLALTPPPFGPRPLWRRLLSIWRRRLMLQQVSPLGGHPAVTRSLLAGLHHRRSGLRWKYLTHYRGERTTVLHVVADPTYVEIGIRAKSEGLCDRLIVGPNITELPHQHNRIQISPEIDRIIVPSDSIARIYEADEPSLKGRLSAWPAGVDPAFWTPAAGAKRRVMIYVKGQPERARAVCDELTAAGFETIELTYGRHHVGQYRAALGQVFASVVVGGIESQGIAMFEAWAMDVPTFVWANAEEPWSASPYLSSATGAFWRVPAELPALLHNAKSHGPRDWLLNHGTDEISVGILLGIAGLAE